MSGDNATRVAMGALKHFDIHAAAWTILTVTDFDTGVAIRGISCLQGHPATFGRIVNKTRGTE